MKHLFLPFFSIYLCIILPLVSYPSDIPPELKNGREVMIKVKKRYIGDTSRGESVMTLTTKNGQTRTRRFVRFVKDYNGYKKSLIRVLYPADLRLTAFLVWENPDTDTQFLYLPAMKKTRRISAKDRDQSFIGSDFSLYDLGWVEIDDFTYSDVTIDVIDDRECYYYVRTAAPGNTAPYSKVQTWIDKERFTFVKLICYDTAGRLLKQVFYKDTRLVQDIWTPHVFIAENLQDGHKSEFRMSKVEYNADVPDNLFSLSNLEACDDIEAGAEAEEKSSR